MKKAFEGLLKSSILSQILSGLYGGVRPLIGGHYQKQAHAQLQVGPKMCDVEFVGLNWS